MSKVRGITQAEASAMIEEWQEKVAVLRD